MEIDLELPSVEQNKLDTESNTNVDIMGRTDELQAEKEDVNGNSGGGDCLDVSNLGEDVNRGPISFEPQNGLEFESKEAAYSFYREYARSVGFGITIKASRRSKRSGKFIDVKVACSRFGSRRESNTAVVSRSCPKTDCKASMHIKRMQDGKWIIYSFVKEHNHEICPDDFYQSIRGRNKQSGVVCQKKGLQLALDEADVRLMLEHFMHMQDENPNFFHAIELGHEKHLKSVFWIDAKGRHDYSNFCDVVFIDTFYIRNKYRIPFVPIVGVNHHFQFLLLGCALVGDETTSTFVWLLKTWLKAMGGQAPSMIITDQDNSLKEAIAEVFPDTRHCFCLWHVLSKIPEKLGCIINLSEIFMTKFNKCIYQSWTDEQFEKRWWKMVDKFELKENEWIQSLYKDRTKWVPVYMRDKFLAGISTTERSGSIASFFDKYLHRETTFEQFLDQYKAFLEDRYEMEARSDLEMRHGQPVLKFVSPFEKQMSSVYTQAIFTKFQVEVLGAMACHLQKEREDEGTIIYQVDDLEERQSFIVAWNETELCINCLCRSFEYRGFLCRHALIVLQMSGVFSIPPHYILKRWMRDAKIRPTGVNEISKGLQYRLQRFDDLCKRAIKLGEEGSLSEETYEIAFQALEEALKHCVGVNSSGKSVLESSTYGIHGLINTENHGKSVAKAAKKKKTYKKRKVQFEQEGTTIGMQSSCHQIEPLNSRAETVDNCYVPQPDMQEIEIGSRPPTLEGYYGAQQSMQGYYGRQQSMQGLLFQGQFGFKAPTMHGCFDVDSMEDMDQSMCPPQFHGIGSKHVHDKNPSR